MRFFDLGCVNANTACAPTPEELRAKEDEIHKAQDSGVDCNTGVTMNVYTHASYVHAEKRPFRLPEKARMLVDAQAQYLHQIYTI